MKYILGGHWTNSPEGWTVLTEQECDMTKPLPWNDNSVDQIFVEHVHEHLNFIDGVNFVKEAYRVLKPGGVIRIVGPYGESICSFRDFSDPITRNFIKTQVSPYYKEEFARLEQLGIDPYSNGKQFFLDSLFKRHNHKMIWSSNLLFEVMKKMGYSLVSINDPNDSAFVPDEDCLERKVRGLNLDELASQGITIKSFYDPESLVVEAQK